MIEYPTLEALGVEALDHVIKYSLSREADVDVIKVHYRRERGSVLERSVKFHFKRGQQVSTKADGSSEAHVCSQYLLAIEELRKLVSLQPEQKQSNKKQAILDNIDKLDAVIESKLNQIHQQIDDYRKD
ncbi:MAG: DUF3461 family protein [Pseudomonadales bacterium]